MRIIITGGTGVLGGALVHSLAADRHEVILLSRNPDRHRRRRYPVGVSVVQWDARTADGWGHLVEGADAIVNLVDRKSVV